MYRWKDLYVKLLNLRLSDVEGKRKESVSKNRGVAWGRYTREADTIVKVSEAPSPKWEEGELAVPQLYGSPLSMQSN